MPQSPIISANSIPTKPQGNMRIAEWIGILLLVATLRIGVSLTVSDGFQSDPDAYRALAESWTSTGTYGLTQADGKVHPTAFRPPLYPWLLSWGPWWMSWGESNASEGAGTNWSQGWVLLLHTILGVLTSLFTMSIAQRLISSKPLWVYLSALLVAIDPILLHQSTLVMTETLATCLTMLTWWTILRVRYHLQTPLMSDEGPGTSSYFLIGITIGLGSLCRPTGLLWGIGILAYFWVCGWFLRRPDLLRDRKKVCSFAIIGILAWIGPWMIRNQIELGHPVAMTTHGGYTLYLANNNSIYTHFQEHGFSRHWDARDFHDEWGSRRIAGEWHDDRLAEILGKQTIQEQPLLFLKSCIIRVSWLWAWWPAEGSQLVKWPIGIWYAAWTTLSLLGAVSLFGSIWRGDRWILDRWMPAFLLIATLTVVHAVYWSNMRMRAPAIPACYLLGILLLQQHWGRFGFQPRANTSE